MDQFDTLTQLAHINVDPERAARTGVSEIILAERKSTAQLLEAIETLLEKNGKAIVSRVAPEVVPILQAHFAGTLEAGVGARTMVIRRTPRRTTAPLGRVGILTAGTSDVEVAEEARIVCEESGCEVSTAYDVGVAGIHRLAKPLRLMTQTNGCRVLIVAAGMDGALPTVVAGLVDLPVIGLPTSVGYGLGAAGVGALTTMLQSCAPGIAVVNIDNGVGAAAMAIKILRQIGKARTYENPLP